VPLGTTSHNSDKIRYGSETYPGLRGIKALSSLWKVCPPSLRHIPNCGIRVEPPDAVLPPIFAA
jgi:hypothetical protein